MFLDDVSMGEGYSKSKFGDEYKTLMRAMSSEGGGSDLGTVSEDSWWRRRLVK